MGHLQEKPDVNKSSTGLEALPFVSSRRELLTK